MPDGHGLPASLVPNVAPLLHLVADRPRHAKGVPWACFHMPPFFSLISAVLHHERHSHPSPWSGRGLTPPRGPPGQGVTRPAAWEHRTSLVAFYYYTHSQETPSYLLSTFFVRQLLPRSHLGAFAHRVHETGKESATIFLGALGVHSGLDQSMDKSCLPSRPRSVHFWSCCTILVASAYSTYPILDTSAMCEAGYRPRRHSASTTTIWEHLETSRQEQGRTMGAFRASLFARACHHQPVEARPRLSVPYHEV
jgi:hypothetical protein